MEESELGELKQFIDRCKSNPSILHNPSLAFFKSYLQSLGARIPPLPNSVRPFSLVIILTPLLDTHTVPESLLE
ncbi:hypothetical protein Dimus_026868 [Dionaea muscipula]